MIIVRFEIDKNTMVPLLLGSQSLCKEEDPDISDDTGLRNHLR